MNLQKIPFFVLLIFYTNAAAMDEAAIMAALAAQLEAQARAAAQAPAPIVPFERPGQQYNEFHHHEHRQNEYRREYNAYHDYRQVHINNSHNYDIHPEPAPSDAERAREEGNLKGIREGHAALAADKVINGDLGYQFRKAAQQVVVAGAVWAIVEGGKVAFSAGKSYYYQWRNPSQQSNEELTHTIYMQKAREDKLNRDLARLQISANIAESLGRDMENQLADFIAELKFEIESSPHFQAQVVFLKKNSLDKVKDFKKTETDAEKIKLYIEQEELLLKDNIAQLTQKTVDLNLRQSSPRKTAVAARMIVGEMASVVLAQQKQLLSASPVFIVDQEDNSEKDDE